MKTIASILFILLTLNAFSQEQGIKFYEDKTLGQLLQKADSAKKLVFIDCYAVWCGPCKYLTREIFPQKEVADFYNANFICGKFDMEKGEGIDIKAKYGVKAFPTLLFLNANGEIVHIQVGSGDVQSILKLGKTALDPANNLKAVKAKLETGDLSTQTVNQYLEINPYADDRDSLLNKYFSTLSAQDKVSESTWNLINSYIENYDNPFFKFLLENEAGFKKIAGAKVDTKIFEVFVGQISRNSRDEEKKAKVEKELKALNHPMVAKAFNYMQFSKVFREVRSDNTAETWKAFMAGAKEYLSTSSDGGELNQIAWFVYENYKKANDTEGLKTAKDWAWKSMDLGKNAFNLDTYANIVYDLGNTADAIKYEEEAIAAALKEGDQGMAKSLQVRLGEFKGNDKK